MAKPSFRYLVFLDSNGYILLDVTTGHPLNTPAVKDMALSMWNNENVTYTRNDVSKLGPLIIGSPDEEARNAQRSAGNMTKLVGNDLVELSYSDWKTYMEVNNPEMFTTGV